MMTLSSADTSITRAFKSLVFFRIIGHCYREQHVYTREELLDAATTIREDYRRQENLVSYRYSFEHARNGLKSSGGGGASGFKIDGKIHSIWSGPGYCDLQYSERNDRNEVIAKHATDVRDLKVIQTDNWGPMRITRRKLKLTLPDQLDSLISFLKNSPDTHLKVFTSDGPSSVMDLIRFVHQGNEGAEESLFNGGDSTKQQLLTKLTDKKSAKYRRTIAWVLLTCFPSPESRSAIESALNSESDPTRQRELAMLLAATAK
jgi:hypothetical protein